MDRWAGKVAIVTGASSGIGLATAVALVLEGMVVVGIARRKALMEEKINAAINDAKGQFYAQKYDISIEQNVIDAFEDIKKNIGTIHVLVNNAGVSVRGTILQTNGEDWHKIFKVNVLGLLYCTQQALKIMKEADVEGHIVNMNSITGHRAHKFADLSSNVYSASKHAITATTETLQKENLGDKYDTR